jgi:hypothetical protein
MKIKRGGKMVKLIIKEEKKTATEALAKEIELLFNVGPFPGGGDCLIVKADGEITMLNSNDLIEDIEEYDIKAL